MKPVKRDPMEPVAFMLDRVSMLMKRISLDFMGIKMVFMVKWDQKFTGSILNIYQHEPRVFIQIKYWAPDRDTGKRKVFKGKKWYLSEHATDDEIVKNGYLAFRTCVEHEVLEAYKVDGITLFNPHTDFEQLLSISHKEVKREEK